LWHMQLWYIYIYVCAFENKFKCFVKLFSYR
jgi:hypothetical protein